MIDYGGEEGTLNQLRRGVAGEAEGENLGCGGTDIV